MEAPQKRRENAVVPMIECMDLFSRRQSIHHIRLPNLALNEQRYPALSCSAGGRQITLALTVALVLDSRCPQGRRSLLSLSVSLLLSLLPPSRKKCVTSKCGRFILTHSICIFKLTFENLARVIGKGGVSCATCILYFSSLIGFKKYDGVKTN